MRDTTGNPARARQRHLACTGSQSQRRVGFILPNHRSSSVSDDIWVFSHVIVFQVLLGLFSCIFVLLLIWKVFRTALNFRQRKHQIICETLWKSNVFKKVGLKTKNLGTWPYYKYLSHNKFISYAQWAGFTAFCIRFDFIVAPESTFRTSHECYVELIWWTLIVYKMYADCRQNALF